MLLFPLIYKQQLQQNAIENPLEENRQGHKTLIMVYFYVFQTFWQYVIWDWQFSAGISFIFEKKHNLHTISLFEIVSLVSMSSVRVSSETSNSVQRSDIEGLLFASYLNTQRTHTHTHNLKTSRKCKKQGIHFIQNITMFRK